jgi:predicted nucleotidyltransferase
LSRDPNIDSVELVARALGALTNDLVLVGGCAVGLLITDTAGPPIRATQDVDLVTEVATLADYYQLTEQLKERGFREKGDIICRWCKGSLIVDVMPATALLGFANRWYPLAIQDARQYRFEDGQTINVISAPLFVATKLESFNGRGNGDYGHHDIEDIISLVDSRPELCNEIEQCDEVVREFVRQEVDDLLADATFVEQLPWHLHPDQASQARLPLIIERLRILAGL